MPNQFLSGIMPWKPGRAALAADYRAWHDEVKARFGLPSYKIRKLWKLGFGVKDIAAGKHREVFPNKYKPPHVPVKPGAMLAEKRGRALSRGSIERGAMKHLRAYYTSLIWRNRMEESELRYVRGMIELLGKKIADSENKS